MTDDDRIAKKPTVPQGKKKINGAEEKVQGGGTKRRNALFSKLGKHLDQV